MKTLLPSFRSNKKSKNRDNDTSEGSTNRQILPPVYLDGLFYQPSQDYSSGGASGALGRAFGGFFDHNNNQSNNQSNYQYSVRSNSNNSILSSHKNSQRDNNNDSYHHDSQGQYDNLGQEYSSNSSRRKPMGQFPSGHSAHSGLSALASSHSGQSGLHPSQSGHLTSIGGNTGSGTFASLGLTQGSNSIPITKNNREKYLLLAPGLNDMNFGNHHKLVTFGYSDDERRNNNDSNEWLAYNSIFLFQNTKSLWKIVSILMTQEEHSKVMNAPTHPDKRTDESYKRDDTIYFKETQFKSKIKCSAPEYINFSFNEINALIGDTSELVFLRGHITNFFILKSFQKLIPFQI